MQSVKDLLAASAIKAVTVIGQPGGFVIAFDVGLERRVLSSAREPQRRFTLPGAAKFLKQLGIVGFVVDTRQWTSKDMFKEG